LFFALPRRKGKRGKNKNNIADRRHCSEGKDTNSGGVLWTFSAHTMGGTRTIFHWWKIAPFPLGGTKDYKVKDVSSKNGVGAREIFYLVRLPYRANILYKDLLLYCMYITAGIQSKTPFGAIV
jgi:hypothetical protein